MLSFFKRPITKDESRDTGMAMVLLLLLLHLASKRDGIIYGAMTFHVMNMTVPQFFKPVASVWLGISHLLGIVVSKILLS